MLTEQRCHLIGAPAADSVIDDWVTAGRDVHLPEPCGLGVLVLCKFWAACAIAGVAAAVIVDRLLGREP